MRIYKSKYSLLSGSDKHEVMKLARYEYHLIQKKTPRRVPYVRSKYFIKDKIFINNFWEHLNQKSPKERVKRLKLYPCAIDLLRNSTYTPDTIFSNTNMNINLHRFYGQTKQGNYFCVQVQENKRNNRKEFISVFPAKNPGK
jgi:hypothetical protein